MEIRKLTPKEKQETRALYEEIFTEDSRAFVDYYYTWKTIDNHIYGLWEDRELQAMIHLNPYPMVIENTLAETHYIVAVATREKYRGRGFMATLLSRALNEMHQYREPFTFLMPAAEAIYHRHGFRTVYRQEKPYHKEWVSPGEGMAWERARLENAGEMAVFASRRLREKYQLYVPRDKAYYQRLIREYESDHSCLMILRDSRGIRDLGIRGEDPGEMSLIMVRIVHVMEMLSCLRVKEKTDIVFRVEDPLIEGNCRCFRLWGDRAAGIRVTEAEEDKKTGRISIEELTEVVFGRISPKEMAEKNHRTESKGVWEALAHILPLQDIYISETV